MSVRMQLLALLLTGCASRTPEPVPPRAIVFITLTPSPAVSIVASDEPLPFRDLSTATPTEAVVPLDTLGPPPAPATGVQLNAPTPAPVVVSASTQASTQRSNPQSLISIQPTAVPPTEAPAPTVVPAQPAFDVASAEQAVIDLSNAQRAANGLPPLSRDEAIMTIARSRSADMIARDYFGHTDPLTGALMAKPQVMALGYGRAGENIYWGGTALAEFPAHAVSWFMGDAPHRANILSPAYTAIGVGIAWNGLGWALTQNFGGP